MKMILVTDIGDGLGHFDHQYPLSFYISVGHQHRKDVTNIEFLPPTSQNIYIFFGKISTYA